MQVQNNVQVGGLSAVGAAIGGIATQASAEAVEAAATSAESTGAITTRDVTVALGNDVGGGYRKVVAAPGENWALRTELLPSYSLPGSPTRRPLIAFAQMTDLHIIDDQSPMRTEYLDKYADPGAPYNAAWPTDASYRAHEGLSTHLNDAMVRAIAKVGAAPATGLPLCMTLVTGDAIDNCQYNEARWYIDLLDGNKTITPNSGDGGDSSVTAGLAGSKPDYWRPGTGYIFGTKHVNAGFPAIPGYEAASRRPYTSHGLGMPWYAALGNHDTLVQGNAPISTNVLGFNLSEIAVGNKKIIDWNHDLPVSGGFTDWLNQVFSNNPVTITVPSDANRRLLSKSALIQEHFNTSGTPVGHGFTTTSKGYYTIPSGADELFKFICLDTNAPIYKEGIIDKNQFAWLENELKACHSKYELTDGSTLSLPTVVHQPQVKDKLVVIFCHHTISSMNSPLLNLPGNDDKSGEDLKNLLWRFPNVIMVVNGHSHDNRIRPYKRNSTLPYASNFPGGFWEINTASHIDWPIQSRIIEVTESSAGVLSIYTTMVDIDAPLDYAGDLSTPATLASLARELAANDLQEPNRAQGVDKRRGEAADRNALLVLPTPFELPVRPAKVAAAKGGYGGAALFGINGGFVFGNAEFQWTYDSWSRGYLEFDAVALSTVIAAGTNADGSIELFSLDKNGAIVRRRGNHAGFPALDHAMWSVWTPLDGAVTSIATALDNAGKLGLFGATVTGEVQVRWQTAANATTWSGWVQLGRPGSEFVRAVAAATDTYPLVRLFAVTNLGRIYTRQQQAPWGLFSSWTAIPGTLSSIAVTPNQDGRLHLFGTDARGRVLHSRETTPGGAWSSWSTFDAAGAPADFFATSVTAVTAFSGDPVHVLAIDSKNRLFYRRQLSANSSDWTHWEKLPDMLPATVKVPYVVGMEKEAAQTYLKTHAGFFNSSATPLWTYDTTKHGKIVSQTPAAGTAAGVGSTVTLKYGAPKPF